MSPTPRPIELAPPRDALLRTGPIDDTVDTPADRTEEWPAGSLSKALADLEWPRLVEAVAARCRGPLGERLDDLPLAESPAEARANLRETGEAHRLAADGDPLPIDGAREIRGSLDRLRRRGALTGPDLRDIAQTLGAARVLRRYLSRHRDDAPALHTACAIDPTLDDVQDELVRAVEPDGRLADTASPELGRLRTEVANLRARIVAKLEQMLLKHEDIIQDRFHTVREGRYVLPVRTDAHEKIPGLVHGTSSSGATVFVEPRAIITQGNRLKMAQGELEREEARLLGILSARVAERLAEIEAAVRAVDRADLRQASARLGQDLGGTVIELDDEPALHLVDARHPVLALDGVEVVPNDLSLAAGQGMVISGPNAGGKTVALKLLGLSALMLRAGLPLPAAEGSRAGFFGPVLTDVGDEQSLEKNLSTFSAHVTNLVRVLREAGPRALILIDEIATGTDPGEGGALACALLEAFTDAGAAVAVTTHYEALKALATQHPALRNAAVGFDVARMAPTFRVRLDVPGTSSALAVAARFGMPEAVLARAREVLPEQSRTFEALVARLEARFASVDDEQRAAAEVRREAERLRAEARAELAELAARDKKQLSEEANRLMTRLREARAELRDARKALRKKAKHDEAALQAIREKLDRAAGTLGDPEVKAVATAPPAPRDERGTPPRPEALRAGQKVWLPRLRTVVDILEGPERGRLRVGAGPVKLWVSVDEVRLVEDPSAPAPRPRAEVPTTEPEPPPGERNTLDIRGMRVDDALTLTEGFLDRLYSDSEPLAYIVHGIGTGALRDAVRRHLGTVRQYVRRVRAGTLEEGGERITVAYLK